jgi:hypothetical protein
VTAFYPGGRIVYDETGKLLTRTTEGAPDGALPNDTSSDGKLQATSDSDGLITLRDAKGITLVTIDLAADYAILTSPSGERALVGNEAHARCVAGATWLPLDACWKGGKVFRVP